MLEPTQNVEAASFILKRVLNVVAHANGMRMIAVGRFLQISSSYM